MAVSLTGVLFVYCFIVLSRVVTRVFSNRTYIMYGWLALL